MNLRDWMTENRWSAPKFAKKISELSGRNVPPRTVLNWRRGTNVPRAQVVRAIEALTEGAVTFSDLSGGRQ